MVFVTQFGTPQDGQECWGLRATKTGPLGNPIKDAQERGSACCATATCRPSNKKAQCAIVERGSHVNVRHVVASLPLLLRVQTAHVPLIMMVDFK